MQSKRLSRVFSTREALRPAGQEGAALGGGRPRGHLLPGGPNLQPTSPSQPVQGGLGGTSSRVGATFSLRAPPTGPGFQGLTHHHRHQSHSLIRAAWSGFFGSSPETGEGIFYFRLHFCFQFQNQLIANTCLSPGLLQVRKHDKTASGSSPSFQSPGWTRSC